MKALLIFCLCVGLLSAGFAFFPREEAAPVPEIAPVSQPEETPQELFDAQLFLQVKDGAKVEKLSLGDYLVGVLLAEMSGDFPQEALKAQAVAARTFALKQAQSDRHLQAHVCTDFACCQGWTSSENFSASAVAAAKQAVEETDGLVLSFEGRLIDATYFSCSGGQTEAAVAVWGREVPYLQSVESPGEEAAPRYTETLCFSSKEFQKILLSAHPEANLSGSPEGWFGAESRSKGGGLDFVFIGGTPVKGTELRSLFSLRSTQICISVKEGEISFTTYGYGHRVGMSQYGAKAMAEAGADFESILLHYYSQTQLRRLCSAQNPV